ncbi:MAG TPA: peptide ABC transporter substrate-binding protein [Candidatus Rubrimentiphilum sp.]|nr:peptide ABC transporter substrate-binding protein [Candidatus Rubrimentiphilum sp.]
MRGTIAIALAVTLCACAGSGSKQHAAHVLRIADLSDPSSLNPLLAHDQDTIGYDLLICQTLIGLDERNRLVPVLVTRIPSRANGDVSADGRRIVYHLRRGIRFADGVPLSSADVAFTYRAIMDSRNPVLSQDAYRRIASLETPDAHTVIIRLKRRWNAAVSDLFAQSDFAFGILPAHAFSSTQLQRARWEDRAFGTGPFRVGQWRRGDEIVLERNPYFQPTPKLDSVILRMIPDMNSALLALKTHEVDVARVLPEHLADIEGDRSVRLLGTPENATEWLSLQLSRGPTRELRIRRAIAHAVDLVQLRKAFEDAFPIAASFLPPGLAAHDPSIQPYPHDVRRARTFAGPKPIAAVLVTTSGNPLLARLATIVQQQLAAAGIQVTIKTFPVSVFNAPSGPVRNARFTISIDGWLGGADPEQSIVFSCAQATVNGSNISRYCDPRFERLFADQQTTADPIRRKRDFIAMQALIHQALPVVPIYYETYFDGINNRLTGFKRNMLRYPVSPESWQL